MNIKLITGILWMTLSVSIFSQTRLTLKEAWEIALQQNLQLRQQQTQIEKSRQEVAIRKTDLLPTLTATAGYNYVSEVARLDLPVPIPGIPEIEAGVNHQYDMALQIKQPLFTGFRLLNLLRATEKEALSQEYQLQSMKNEILFRIGQLYYEIQSNRIKQQVLSQAIARVDYQLTQVKNLYEVGQLPAFDTLEVANRKLQLRNQQQQLKNMERVLLIRFQHLLNREDSIDVAPLVTEEPTGKLEPLNHYFRLAEQYRPELQQLNVMRGGLLYRRKVLQSTYLPQLFAVASYHYARPGVNFFENQWMDYYTVGVQMQWELWSWKRNRRKVEQASLDVQQLDLKTQQLVKDIRQQIVEAYELLKNSIQQIRYQRELVAQEQERFRITQQQFLQGQASSLEVNSAEKSLTQAEMELQQELTHWKQLKLQLEYSSGIIGKELDEY
ncbi:MAG: TolC family protein [Calditrichaeota bacterium]|nr:MAG: TolC family protein [Calditrichota bacterium]